MNVLKNRMENGTPFLKAMAMERIRALADNLEITQQEAKELQAIAESRGLDVLPKDAYGRLTAVEQETQKQRRMLEILVRGDTEPQEVQA